MTIEILIKYWQLIIGLVLSSIFGFFYFKERSISSYFKHQYEIARRDHEDYVNKETRELLAANQKNRDLESKYQMILTNHEKESNEKIKQLEATRAKSDNLVSSLQSKVSTYKHDMSKLPLSTQVNYSVDYATFFGECSAELRKVGQQAEEESIDKMTLYDSWMDLKREYDRQMLNNGDTK